MNQRRHWDRLYESHPPNERRFPTDLAIAFERERAPGSRVLELGCGRAQDSAYFAERGHRVTAADFSVNVLRAGKARYPDCDGLDFAAIDMNMQLPFTAGAFDAVYARLSLHYFNATRTRALFDEIATIIRPSGRLCFMCKT